MRFKVILTEDLASNHFKIGLVGSYLSNRDVAPSKGIIFEGF